MPPRRVINPDSMNPGPVAGAPSSWVRHMTDILGALRDTIRGVQVGYVGPALHLEKTFNVPANTTQQFTMTVPATMAIDWFTVAAATPATTFLISISIGAVEYFSKRDAAIAPVPPAGVAPDFNRGLLRRIEVIQGDTIVVTVQNTAAAIDRVTLWTNGYRLGAGTCG